MAADAQISDQSLITVMSDTHKYLSKVCENLQTHAGIQMLRAESVKNDTNEIQTFITYVLAAVQKSIVRSIELPRKKRLSISNRTPLLLPDNSRARVDANSGEALRRIVLSVESLSLCQTLGHCAATSSSSSKRSSTASLARHDEAAEEEGDSFDSSMDDSSGMLDAAAAAVVANSDGDTEGGGAAKADGATVPAAAEESKVGGGPDPAAVAGPVLVPPPSPESLQVVEDIDRSLVMSRASMRVSFERVRSLGTPRSGTPSPGSPALPGGAAAGRNGSGAAMGGGAGGGGGGGAAAGGGGSPAMPRAADLEENVELDAAALARERNIQHAKIQQQHRIGTRIFNTEGFKAGLSYFGRYAGCRFDTPKQVAQFLRYAEGISKVQIGELLGKKSTFYREVAVSFFSENYDVVGMELDQALRVFLTGNWMMHYESVNYMMGIFTQVFLTQNPDYKIGEQAMLQGLANALVMLNGFQHNVQSKRTAMSLRRFTELVRSFDITEAHLTAAEVKGFYKRICKSDISPEPMTSQEMVEAVLNYPTKRMLGQKLNRKGKKDRAYFVLRDGCLFFFDKASDKKDPSRVVFLQGCVAHKHPVKDNELLIEHASGGPMLEAKDVSLRLDKTGDHRLVLILESETDRDAWLDAINFEA